MGSAGGLLTHGGGLLTHGGRKDGGGASRLGCECVHVCACACVCLCVPVRACRYGLVCVRARVYMHRCGWVHT